jgi:cytochrome c oxidase subunit IV
MQPQSGLCAVSAIIVPPVLVLSSVVLQVIIAQIKAWQLKNHALLETTVPYRRNLLVS